MNENEIRKIVRDTVSAVKNRKKEMTLALAERIADATVAEAKRMGVNAVVCISDSAGNPRLVKSMDNAYIASYDIADRKSVV